MGWGMVLFWLERRSELDGKGLVRWQRRSEMEKGRFWFGERERVSYVEGEGVRLREWDEEGTSLEMAKKR